LTMIRWACDTTMPRWLNAHTTHRVLEGTIGPSSLNDDDDDDDEAAGVKAPRGLVHGMCERGSAEVALWWLSRKSGDQG
jgi:hypothetical protein